MINREPAAPLEVGDRLAGATGETDAELTARFVRDVTPLAGLLLGAAIRMTPQRADAEDLVQETLMRAYAGFGTFRQGTNLAGWLLRIQANAHISGHRKRLRRPTELPFHTMHDWQPAAHAQRSPSELRSVEAEVLEAWPDDEIRAALGALPREFRMAVYYADVEGLAYKQISAIMCTPVGTVMSRLHRGRSQLRVLLAAVAADRGYHRARQHTGARVGHAPAGTHQP